MKLIALLVLLVGLSMAFDVNPDIIGTKDTGNASLPTADVSITINCDSKDAYVQVRSNDTGDVVAGAKAYMFYTDYGYNVLPNVGITDANGKVTMSVPGYIRFLTALFVLRIDQPNLQSRETEFTYKKCFEPQPPPPPPPTPPKNVTENQTNETPPTVNTTPNITQNATPQPPANNTKPPAPVNNTGGEKPKTPSTCPLGLALLSLLFIGLRR